MREDSVKSTASAIPAHVNGPLPAPTTAVLAVKDLLEAMRDASDMLVPLKTALDHLLKIWNGYNVRQSIRSISMQLMHVAR